MSNFFSDALNDAKGLEEKILGPDYPYWKYIATPAQMGMSDEGSLSATATDTAKGKLVDRYLYINNVPDGSIPFLTAASGIKFTDFEGLIPGIMEDLDALNPITLFRGFMQGNVPPCKEVTLPTKSSTNVIGSATHHVSLTDLQAVEGFQNLNTASEKYNNLYIFVCGIILLYLVQKLLKKN